MKIFGFNIERAKDSQMGYRVRMKIILRAEESFLLAVNPSLTALV